MRARFLQAADRELASKHRLTIIGGAAALLNYGVSRTTTDIDTIQPVAPELEAALQRARETTGLDIPVQLVGIYDAPYNFEERIQPAQIDGLKRLSLFVPERHDLALMKIVRGYEHDIQVIREMHLKTPFDLRLLVRRFREEMTHVVGNRDNHRLSLLAAIDGLFGPEAAISVEPTLDAGSRMDSERSGQ